MKPPSPSGVPGHSTRTSRPAGTRPRPTGPLPALTCTLLLLAVLAGCGANSTAARSTNGAGATSAKTLTIGAIPDQDPEKLQRLYGSVAADLSKKLGVPVVYKPVTDYTAAVSLFRTGDLQLVWFGGLTGVQARLQTPGAKPLVQRDIDGSFHSLFIVNAATKLAPVQDVAGLAELKGKRFTFGSQSSTSGFLMPAYFLLQARVDVDKDFVGPPGYSGSHDKTIDLVQSGSYQAGAVNEQVWNERASQGKVDQAKVKVVFRTPAFHDYHWVLGPSAEKEFGAGFAQKVTQAFLSLDPANPQDAQILSLFGATKFVPTDVANYAQIEQVGRRLGLINQP